MHYSIRVIQARLKNATLPTDGIAVSVRKPDHGLGRVHIHLREKSSSFPIPPVCTWAGAVGRSKYLLSSSLNITNITALQRLRSSRLNKRLLPACDYIFCLYWPRCAVSALVSNRWRGIPPPSCAHIISCPPSCSIHPEKQVADIALQPIW